MQSRSPIANITNVLFLSPSPRNIHFEHTMQSFALLFSIVTRSSPFHCRSSSFASDCRTGYLYICIRKGYLYVYVKDIYFVHDNNSSPIQSASVDRNCALEFFLH